jgi:hypothetical protein
MKEQVIAYETVLAPPSAWLVVTWAVCRPTGHNHFLEFRPEWQWLLAVRDLPASLHVEGDEPVDHRVDLLRDL